MATFALLYNTADLTPLAAAAQDVNLSSGLRSTGNRYWQAGINQWSVAPLASSDARVPRVYYDPALNGDPDCRLLVVSGNNQVTKTGLIQWLRDVAVANPNLLFMGAIAADLANTAIDPWPPP